MNDKSDQHNFHLTGPGDVDVMTEVWLDGREPFTVTLEPGTYTFGLRPARELDERDADRRIAATLHRAREESAQISPSSRIRQAASSSVRIV